MLRIFVMSFSNKNMKKCFEIKKEEKKLNDNKTKMTFYERKRIRNKWKKNECLKNRELRKSSNSKWWRNSLKMIELSRWMHNEDEWRSLSIRKKLRDFGRRNLTCTELREQWNSLKEKLLMLKKEERETLLNKRRLSYFQNTDKSWKSIIRKHQLSMESDLSKNCHRNLKTLIRQQCYQLHRVFWQQILAQSLFQGHKGSLWRGFLKR